jgi:putative selenate reductase FAD-binding subunit
MITAVVRPKSIAEAVKAKSAPGAAYLGGGTWLNSGKAEKVSILISLEHLGLESIKTESGRCVIGASVTFQTLVDSPLVPSALREAARLTPSRTLRNMVTAGGEIGLSPEDSALIPALIALDAEIFLAGRKKPVPIETYLVERRSGLILGLSVGLHSMAAVQSVSRTSHSPRLLVAAVSVGATVPTVQQPMLILSDCRGLRVRLAAAERKLEGSPMPTRQAIEELARGEFSPQSDLYASAAYKRYIGGVLIADLLGGISTVAVR